MIITNTNLLDEYDCFVLNVVSCDNCNCAEACGDNPFECQLEDA